MKHRLLFLSISTLLIFAQSDAGGRGCAGHAHAVTGAHHSNPYRNMRELRDSTYSGYAVLRRRKSVQDTLYGTFSRFTAEDFRLRTRGSSEDQRIAYRKTEVLHLEGQDGALHLVSGVGGPEGFFRLVAGGDSLALYDRQLKPHLSIADADTAHLYFRCNHFARRLDADFENGLRKRVVPLINAHYTAGITRATPRRDVYRIIAGQ